MNRTELRQTLRDQIWLAGPEHFDVSCLYRINGQEKYTGPDEVVRHKDWTACFIGHAHIALNTTHVHGLDVVSDLLNSDNFISTETWHRNQIDDWNPGEAYDTLIANGETDQLAQWHVAVEWLDRLIKGGG